MSTELAWHWQVSNWKVVRLDQLIKNEMWNKVRVTSAKPVSTGKVEMVES